MRGFVTQSLRCWSWTRCWQGTDRHRSWWSNYWSTPGYPTTNTLSEAVLEANESFPRRNFLNFGRRIFCTNFLNHWLANCYCLVVFQCWCCDHHQHRCYAYDTKENKAHFVRVHMQILKFIYN
jgi:hypothetical protein